MLRILNLRVMPLAFVAVALILRSGWHRRPAARMAGSSSPEIAQAVGLSTLLITGNCGRITGYAPDTPRLLTSNPPTTNNTCLRLVMQMCFLYVIVR